jgi:TrmH family RNA methyltransferase
MTAKNSINTASCPENTLERTLQPLLARVRIVLVGTTHAGNIGSTARAMKTMGLTRLMLVQSKAQINEKSIALASSAVDILEQAQSFDSLDAALQGCHWVVGASARRRDQAQTLMTVRQAAEQVQTELLPITMQNTQANETNANHEGTEVALVFGREHAGLTNIELGRCHAHMFIPANPAYSSLNLAQAVQIIAYEIRMALAEGHTLPSALEPAITAPHDNVENLLTHWQCTLEQLAFLDPTQPRHMMQKLRQLLHRARISPNEVDILRGMLTAMQRRLTRKD